MTYGLERTNIHKGDGYLILIHLARVLKRLFSRGIFFKDIILKDLKEDMNEDRKRI